MTRKDKDIKEYTVWLFALFFATLFVFIISWTSLLGREFSDIHNYVERIAYLYGGGSEAIFNGLQWLLDEPLWKGILLFIGEEFTDYRLALYWVSFVAVALHGAFIFKRVEFYIALFFLFNPMSVNLFIEQIRIALAFGLVLLAYESSKKYIAVPLLIMGFLIHASMPVFIGLYGLLYWLRNTTEAKKYYLIALFTALLMAMFMKYGVNIILQALGDRHANYDQAIGGSSIAYSAFWLLLSLVLAIFAEFNNKKERLLVAYAITFLSFFFFASVLGIYAQRYVAVIMPIIIVSISYLPKHWKQWTYLSLLGYNLLMFKYWFTAG